MGYDTILDCYTDEPSGLGVPPYLGVHVRYIAGSLSLLDRKYYYITIDDLRYSERGEKEVINEKSPTINIRIRNESRNRDNVPQILSNADTLFVVMGSFVEYKYLSIVPPDFCELAELLKDYNCKKVLFYALGGRMLSKESIQKSIPHDLFDDIVFGNTYDYLLLRKKDSFRPNYEVLHKVTKNSFDIVRECFRPCIIEIETGSGCPRKQGCSFCIENVRKLPLEFRKINDILEEVRGFYEEGIRHFRLGRQPNFYGYMHSDEKKIKQLLHSIRESCPEIKMLHIDNADPTSVITYNGRKTTEHIVSYCTSGNIAPFGVESFDPAVRAVNNLNGTIEQILDAISILNEYGKERGSDGLPKFLPGINLIYNLPGQSENTLKHNVEKLDHILAQGYFTRRLFIRKCTSPYGMLFDVEDSRRNKSDGEIECWRNLISDRFEKPMLKRVFPTELMLRNFRAEIWKSGSTICRQLATCSVRVLIPKEVLPLDTYYDIKVKGYYDNRTLIGEIVR